MSQMHPRQFNAYCERGSSGDQLLELEQFEPALGIYRSLVEDMFAAKLVDSFVLAKCTLGVLLALALKGDQDEACTLWVKNQAEPGTADPYALGVSFLEQGQCSLFDRLIFTSLAGFFHSMSTGDRAQAVAGIRSQCAPIFERALQREPRLVPYLLSNWAFSYVHLFFPEPVPADLRDEVGAARARWGGKTLEPARLRLPGPSPWKITW